MLRAAIIFFILAIIAALFGFGGIATSAVAIGRLLFYGFVIVAVITLLLGIRRG